MWEIVEDTYVCDPGLAPPDPWDFGGENMVIRESTSRFELIVETRAMPFPSQP